MPRPLAALVYLLAVPPAFAAPALDPDANTPYVWRVVIQAKPHPLLSPAVRDQLVRDVKAALRPTVGPVATVEVLDLAAVTPAARDPVWKAFAETGWPALETPAARRLTGVKTHFLKVEVKGTTYRLEAKQLDGDTGLTSPLLRVQETDAAEKLGRLAGMMLMRDFGPVATLDQYDAENNTATVRFRAGGLDGFDKFVTPGDVLAVAMIVEQPRPAPRYGLEKANAPEPPPVRDGKPREFTLLQVAGPADGGAVRCTVLTRLRNPFSFVRGVAGFRGLKLATVEGPIAVRVVRPVTGEAVPPGGLIRVRAIDVDLSDLRPDPRDMLDLRDGVFRSNRVLRNVAVVYVGLGSMQPVKFPVPVLGSGPPAAIPFEPNEADAIRAEFAKGCEELRARASEARLAQVALFDGFGKLITKGDYPAALDRAKKGLEQQQATEKALAAEVARLRGEPGAKDSTAAALLDSSDALVQGLKLGEPALRQRIEEVQGAIEKSRDPARYEKEFRAKELMARIKQHLEQGEGDEALALYDQLAALTAGQKDIKDARDKLAAEWEPKADEQKRARAYLGGEWRKAASVEELKTALPTVQEAAGVLLKYDDRHGLRGLLASLEPAYTRIKEQADLLDANSTADRPILMDLQAVTSALRDIEAKARETLKKLDQP